MWKDREISIDVRLRNQMICYCYHNGSVRWWVVKEQVVLLEYKWVDFQCVQEHWCVIKLLLKSSLLSLVIKDTEHWRRHPGGHEDIRRHSFFKHKDLYAQKTPSEIVTHTHAHTHTCTESYTCRHIQTHTPQTSVRDFSMRHWATAECECVQISCPGRLSAEHE